ncbi:MotA/TolQ/ExbB proton channel family protein [Porticoccus sp.]
MNIFWLEQMMYQLSGWFMAPVLIAIAVLFLYSLYALGGFSAQWWQRRQNASAYRRALRGDGNPGPVLGGYSLMSQFQRDAGTTMEELDVMALKELEVLRIVTRISPMLGLIATMIPMAPALKALGDGNVQGISENLIIAFSAVIFGMVIASITFWLASVKKRWLAVELVDIARLRQASGPTTEESEELVDEVVREVA